jgi:MFS family permease
MISLYSVQWLTNFYNIKAGEIASKFFQTGSEDGDVTAWLATFAASVVTRPIGAVIFGYLGDTVGRKHTFILTLLITGS